MRLRAEELALIIGAVYENWNFRGDTIVSYSGGLFHAGDFYIKATGAEARGNGICLSILNIRLYRGAALLAAREYNRDGEFLSRIKQA